MKNLRPKFLMQSHRAGRKGPLMMLVAFFLFISMVNQAQITLAGWDGSTVSGWGPASWAPTTSNASLTIGNLTKGAGISNGSTPASFGWGGVNWQGAANEDAEFTITPNAGYQVSLSAFNLNYRRSNTGPSSGTIDYTFGSSTTFTTLGTVSFGNSSSGGSIPAINLSAVAALQNVQPGTTIRFRILPTGGGTAGTWYVYASPGLVVSGSISSAIPPFYGTITQSSFIQCAGNASAVLTTSVTGGTRPYTYSWSPTGGTDSTATGLTAGTYSCFISDAATPANTAIATYTVGEPTALATSITSQSLNCYGGSDGTSTVIATGGTAPYNYSWSPTGGSADVATNLTSGIYTVTILDGHSCSTSQTVEIIEPSTSPSISVSASSSSVCAGSTVVLTGSGANSYTWTSGVIDGVAFTPTATMDYSVSGTTTSGCNGYASITVSVNANPTITVNSGAICPGGSFTITPGGASTYTFSGGSVVAPTTQTTYSVYGESAEGCAALSPAISTVNVVTSLTVTIGGSPMICNGQPANLTAGGATSYTWSTGGMDYTIAPTPTVNTTYTVTGVSSTCSNTAAITITVNATPSVSISGPSVTCSGAAITLTASGANTYLWNDGTSTSTIALTPTATASYSAVGTGTNGCNITAVKNITVNANPTISVTGGTICSGTAFTFAPSGANTYTVSGGSNVVTPSVTTTYSVTGTNSLGCVSPATATVTLNVKNTPTISVNSGAICQGDSFTLTPGSAGSYSFQNGGPVVTPTTSTAYSVITTNSTGCVGTAISNVTVTPYPVIAINDATVCAGSVFSISPTGAANYTYSNGSSTVIPTGNTSYSITGSTLGCAASNTAVVNVTVVAVPVLTINSGTICGGALFTLTPGGASTYTYSGGSATITPTVTTVYTVSGTSTLGCIGTIQTTINIMSAPTISLNSGAICNGGSFTITPSGADTYTFLNGSSTVSPTITTSYSVAGTNTTTGCMSANPGIATVTVNSIPTLSVNGTSTLACAGGNVTLTASGANTYSWSTTSTNTTVVVTPTANAVYSVTGNSNGCFGSAMYSVAVNPTPTITVPAGIICSGGSFTLMPSGASTYTFSSGPIVSPTVTTNYTVSGTDANGCVSSTVAVVTLTNSIVVSIAGNTLLCGGQPATLTASGASTYSWNTGALTNTIAPTPTATTIYTVNGISAACNNSAVITVSVMSGPSISVVASSSAVCNGHSVTLTATGAGTLTWSGGITDGTAFTPTATTVYSVSGTGTNGCMGTVITTVTVNSNPTITATTNSATICSGESITLTANGALTYSWSASTATTPTVVVLPLQNTTYTVIGTDAHGCMDTTTVSQAVSICTGINSQALNEASLIVFPNPNNGDFTIKTTSAARLTLVNELGQLVRVIHADSIETQVKGLNAGIYFLVGSDNNLSVKQKIVVTH